MLIFIFNHCVKSFFSADYTHTSLCSCNSRIQKIPCHKHRSSRNQRHYNCRIFATLRFMNCNSISQFQLFCLFRIKCNISVIIKLYFYIISNIIYFLNNSHISVKNAGAGIHKKTFICPLLPFKLIIIFNLHNLVAFSENDTGYLFFVLIFVRWIHIHL